MHPGHEEPEAPTEVPQEPDGEHERSLGKVATLIGILTGVFGALLSVGLVLLPASTAGEKALIVGTCGALSAASLAGVGARRSARRFVGFIVVTGLAIVSLAGLSIAAADGVQQPSSGSASLPPASPSATSSSVDTVQPSNAPSEATPATSAAAAASPTLRPSATDNPAYLSKMTGTAPPGDPGPESGDWTMSGIRYASSLGYPDLCLTAGVGAPVSVTYNLNGSYQSFTAEVGVDEGAAADEQGDQFTFEVDGAASGGTSNELGSKSAQYGQPASITVNVQGITQLTLTISLGDNCITGSTAVWGSARLSS